MNLQFFKALFFLSIQLVAMSCLAHASTRTVALTGDAAVGLPDGIFYDQLGTPSMNSQGQVAFFASLAGQGVDQSNLFGRWTEATGSLQQIARDGSQVPDLPVGVNFAAGSSLYISSSGLTLFNNTLTGNVTSDVDDKALLLHSSTGVETIARTGDQAPGVPSGQLFTGGFVPALSSSGQVAIKGVLDGPGVDTSTNDAIWIGDPRNLQLLVREGDEAPGTPVGVTFGHDFLTSTFARPTVNNAAETAFFGRLAGPGVDASNDRGIWAGDVDELNLIARSGNQAPGVPAGVNYSNFSSGDPTFNSHGDVAFVSLLTGLGVDSTNDKGVFRSNLTATDVKLVARAGQQAPGLPVEANFVSFSSTALSSTGRSAIIGRVSGGGFLGANGVWTEGSGDLELVTIAGDRAPGTPEGVHFAIFFSHLVVNAQGQTAFRGVLTGDGIELNGTNDRGLWAQGLDGQLRLLAREGDLLEVAENDFRRIASLGFISGGTEEGFPTGFNDRGELAFSASFVDGTQGIFVSQLVAIPEPCSGFLALCGVATGLLMRRSIGRRTAF